MVHYINYTTPQLQQLQLQLHYTYYTLQLQLHYTTLQLQLQLRYTTLHPEVVGEVTTATIATTPKKQNFNHLSVHHWIRSAIRDSQQPTSPLGFLFLKLPPPPCAVLLVYRQYIINISLIYHVIYRCSQLQTSILVRAQQNPPKKKNKIIQKSSVPDILNGWSLLLPFHLLPKHLLIKW